MLKPVHEPLEKQWFGWPTCGTMPAPTCTLFYGGDGGGGRLYVGTGGGDRILQGAKSNQITILGEIIPSKQIKSWFDSDFKSEFWA